MKSALAIRGACAAIAVLACVPAANAQDASGKQDRLALTVSGQKLTDTDGGWGAAALWLHNFNEATIFGLGGEHQSLADADWNFGKITLNHGFGEAYARTNLYIEANEGSGRDLTHDYDYSIVTAGVYQNLSRQFTLQLEDKQVDVDTVTGNLPKLGMSYLWSPSLSTSVGYAYSVSGNLDTRLATARIDGFTKTMNVFAGLANGPAAPIVINLPPGVSAPSVVLHEYYVGIGRAFSRADTTLVLDFARLGESNHWTLSFNTTLHKRTGAGR